MLTLPAGNTRATPVDDQRWLVVVHRGPVGVSFAGAAREGEQKLGYVDNLAAMTSNSLPSGCARVAQR
jgi:hypothetical protein